MIDQAFIDSFKQEAQQELNHLTLEVAIKK